MYSLFKSRSTEYNTPTPTSSTYTTEERGAGRRREETERGKKLKSTGREGARGARGESEQSSSSASEQGRS